jgi:hypothetical protein
MKVIKAIGKAKVSVICCVHGDEPFGAKVFEFYSSRVNKIEGLQLILANEEALAKGDRFVDTDLNRCFPGKREGNNEERLAHSIIDLLQGSQYVIDVHTTTSDIAMTPIVANLGAGVKRIINLCTSVEVVEMDKGITEISLIGSVLSGVSLEFNEKYAKTDQAFEEVRSTIDGLLSRSSRNKIVRQIYQIDRIISLDTVLPKDAVNFTYIKSLGIYPFLLGEKAYMDFQGFAAKKARQLTI